MASKEDNRRIIRTWLKELHDQAKGPYPYIDDSFCRHGRLDEVMLDGQFNLEKLIDALAALDQPASQ